MFYILLDFGICKDKYYDIVDTKSFTKDNEMSQIVKYIAKSSIMMGDKRKDNDDLFDSIALSL